jgi:hypothetical protein
MCFFYHLTLVLLPQSGEESGKCDGTRISFDNSRNLFHDDILNVISFSGCRSITYLYTINPVITIFNISNQCKIKQTRTQDQSVRRRQETARGI